MRILCKTALCALLFFVFSITASAKELTAKPTIRSGA